jgi:hypothetical protein
LISYAGMIFYAGRSVSNPGHPCENKNEVLV